MSMSAATPEVPVVSRFHVPGAPLSELVACFWYVDGPAPPEPTERVLPDGAAQIIFSLRGTSFRVYGEDGRTVRRRLPGAIVTGPSARFTIIDTRDTAATVGVAFRPGFAEPCLGTPLSLFTAQDVGLDAVWGRAAADRLHARLADAGSPDAAFRILEASLSARLVPRLAPHPAVRHALEHFDRTGHTASIARVAADLGLSHRRFIDLFERALGLAPKRFCRVRRLQRVLGAARRTGRPSWTDLAAACGYADQAHLIHDFRALAGITPTAYVARQTAHQNHAQL